MICSTEDELSIGGMLGMQQLQILTFMLAMSVPKEQTSEHCRTVAAYFANGLDILLEVVDSAPAVVHALVCRFLHVRWWDGWSGSHTTDGMGNS